MATHLSLDQLESLVKSKTPVEIFSDVPADIEHKLKTLRMMCHPDLHPGQEDRAKRLFQSLGVLAEAALQPPLVVMSPTRAYTLGKRLAIGDIADVYLATADAKSYIFKISRIPKGDELLERERATVAELLTAAGDTYASRCIPTLVESFVVKDKFRKRVNVYVHVPNVFTFEQIREKYPAGVDDRHVIWMAKRIFAILDFVHAAEYVVGGILPSHVMVNAANHGAMLLGWPHAARFGSRVETISTKYKSMYPREVLDKKTVNEATDVYMAARCLAYIAGGDPRTDTIPATAASPIRRILRRCLLEAQSMRPVSARMLHDDFHNIGKDLFGSPKFHQLVM